MVGFTDILNLLAVDVGSHLLLPVVVEDGLNLAGELERQARAPRRLDRQVRTFAGRHAAEKGEVVVLLLAERVLLDREAVVHDARVAHRLPPRLRGADRDVVNRGIPRVLFAQHRLVRMMNGQHRRLIGKQRERRADDVVEVYQICRLRCLVHRPRGVIGVLELCRAAARDGPVRVAIAPLELAVEL